jgi:Ca2+-binding RTX toxin-like protein
MQFLPKANFFGTETIEITVNDKGNIGSGGVKTTTNTLSIDIQPVNDAPFNTVLTTDITTLEDTPIVFNGNNLISISDVDAENKPVQVTLTATNGTLTLSSTNQLTFLYGSDGINDTGMVFEGTIADINAALAGMTFNPTPETSGAATVKITTSDLGNTGNPNNPNDDEVLTATNTINITIQSVNDSPVNQVPGNLTTEEDKPIVFSQANGNLISISDVDAGSNPVQVTLVVTNGTLSLSGVTGLSFSNGNGNGLDNATMTFSGTVADINTALAGMTFKPTPNSSIPATIEITTDDLGNSGGTSTPDKDIIEISVTTSNDPPVHTLPKEVTTQEDTPFIFSGEQLISVSDADAGSNEVEVTLTATNGTLNLNGTIGLFVTIGNGIDDKEISFRGSLDKINAALAGMTFNPDANVFGEGSVTITTNDLGNTGGAAVTVSNTVKVINEPPVNLVPITDQSTIANTPLVFSKATNNPISISDIDALSNPVKVTLTATDGSLSLNTNSIAKLNFSQGVGDGTNDVTMTFTGTIEDINAALDGMTFNPTTNFSGVGKVTILTNDRGYTGKTGEAGALTDSDSIDITVIPIVSIAAIDATANESGNDTGTFRISRTGTVGNVTVNFAIANTSTASVNDYTLNLKDKNQLSVEIPDGQSFVDLILTAIDDTLPEAEESLQLDLVAGSGYVLNTDKSTAKVTIVANDAITYGVVASNLSANNSINEGDTEVKTLAFTVTRGGGIGVTSQVDYAIGGTATLGSDYNNIKVTGGTSVQAGTLNFAVGETSKTITVDVIGDKTFELDETLSVTLTNPRPEEAPASAKIVTNLAAVKIVNDDSVPTISVDNITVSEGNTGAFNVTLSNPSYQKITVDYSIIDGTAKVNSDYTATAYTGTLTFNPGDIAKTIDVTALFDNQFENPETFSVKLASSTNAGIKAGVGIATIAPLNTISGTSGADNIMGTANSDRILGLDGDDLIIAGLSADEIDGGDGNDTIFGDLISGVANITSSSSDLIKGGNGNDRIYGGEGKDWVYGEAGDDLLWGNDGDDELWGGLGNDYLTGGLGNDIFVIARNEGIDTINDFSVGQDVIRLSGGLIYSALSFTQVLSNTFISDNATQKHLAVLTGVQASTLTANSFI